MQGQMKNCMDPAEEAPSSVASVWHQSLAYTLLKAAHVSLKLFRLIED